MSNIQINAYTLRLNQEYWVTRGNIAYYKMRYLGMNTFNNVLSHVFIKDDNSIVTIPFVTYCYKHYGNQ